MRMIKLLCCVAAVGYTWLAGCQSSAPDGDSPGAPSPAPGAFEKAVEERLAATRSNREMQAVGVLEGAWQFVVEPASSTGDKAEPLARGHAKLSRVLGNRFLEWHVAMQVAGQELSSRGLLGYDEAFERYEFLWVSELSGAQRLARGRGNPMHEGLVLEYVDSDAMTGAQARIQLVLRAADNDHFVLEQRSHDSATDSWVPTVRTRYTRLPDSVANGAASQR